MKVSSDGDALEIKKKLDDAKKRKDDLNNKIEDRKDNFQKGLEAAKGFENSYEALQSICDEIEAEDIISADSVPITDTSVEDYFDKVKVTIDIIHESELAFINLTFITL